MEQRSCSFRNTHRPRLILGVMLPTLTVLPSTLTSAPGLAQKCRLASSTLSPRCAAMRSMSPPVSGPACRLQHLTHSLQAHVVRLNSAGIDSLMVASTSSRVGRWRSAMCKAAPSGSLLSALWCLALGKRPVAVALRDASAGCYRRPHAQLALHLWASACPSQCAPI